ncbi:MAG: NADPH:quinone oxidoreductase family protein [Alphaproteobacteria bacterium]
MKAALCTVPGRIEDVVVAEIEPPALPDDGLLVRVHAAGVNFPDLLLVRGQYQEKPTPPFAPGLEVAGVVDAVGKDVTDFAPGDRVMATLRHGGFAEFAAVKAANAVKLPATVSLDAAAALPIAYGTAYHAFAQRARLEPGETLLVLGAAGGVGLAAVELGRRFGARVIAVASTVEKRAAAKAAGAHEAIGDEADQLAERVKALTDGRGADVVFDPVGGDLFDQALRCVAPDGRVLVIGFASGRIGELKANRLLLKECGVLGVYWGAYARRKPAENAANFARLIEWLEAGELAPPIWRRFSLAEVPEALAALANRQVIGKAIIAVRDA